MPPSPSSEFVTLAKEVAATGKPRTLPVRNLLASFELSRRGSQVVRQINASLRKLGVETEARFDALHIDSTEPEAEHVAVQRLSQRRPLERADQRIPTLGPVFAPVRDPGLQVRQGSRVPPEGHTAGLAAFGSLGADR